MELSIQKSSRFFTPFFIATNIANKPLSDCITSLKTILLFHFSPKPTAEGETKRPLSKQLQFHKINTKKKNICRTPTIWRQSNLPSNISQFVPWSKLSNLSALHWTLPIPKTRKRLKCIHSQINSSKHIKINWFSVNHSTSAWVKFISILLDNTTDLILLLRATKLVLSTKIILNYTFITKYDINAKLPNTQPTEYPT